MRHLDPITRNVSTLVVLGLVAYVVLFDITRIGPLVAAAGALTAVVTAFAGGRGSGGGPGAV